MKQVGRIAFAILGGLVLPQFAEMPGGWWAFLLAAGLTYGVTYLV